MVIVDAAHFAHQYRAVAGLAPKLVVEPGREGHRAAGPQLHPAARRNFLHQPVHFHVHGRRGQSVPIAAVPELDHQDPPAPVDDVLHFDVVEMGGRTLIFPHHHDFLGVILGNVGLRGREPIAEGEQDEALAGKVATAKIGDVPPQIGRYQGLGHPSLGRPMAGSPCGKGGQMKAVLPKKGDGLAQ